MSSLAPDLTAPLVVPEMLKHEDLGKKKTTQKKITQTQNNHVTKKRTIKIHEI